MIWPSGSSCPARISGTGVWIDGLGVEANDVCEVDLLDLVLARVMDWWTGPLGLMLYRQSFSTEN